MYESKEFIMELCSSLRFSIVILERNIRNLLEDNTDKFLLKEYKEKLKCLEKDYEVVKKKASDMGQTFYNASEAEWS